MTSTLEAASPLLPMPDMDGLSPHMDIQSPLWTPTEILPTLTGTLFEDVLMGNTDDIAEADPINLTTPNKDQGPAQPVDLSKPIKVEAFLNKISNPHPTVEVTPEIIEVKTPVNRPPAGYPVLRQRLASKPPIIDTPEETIVVPLTLLQGLQKIAKNHSKRLMTCPHRELKHNIRWIKYKLARMEAAIETELMAGQETPELLASMFMRQELEQFCTSQQNKLITKLSHGCHPAARIQNHKLILASARQIMSECRIRFPSEFGPSTTLTIQQCNRQLFPNSAK